MEMDVRVLVSFRVTPALPKSADLVATLLVGSHPVEGVAPFRVAAASQVPAADHSYSLPGAMVIPFSFEKEQELLVQVAGGSARVRVAHAVEERQLQVATSAYRVTLTCEEENAPWLPAGAGAGAVNPAQLFGDPIPMLDLAIETAPQQEVALKEELVLQLSALDLPRGRLLSSMDPFFVLKRSLEGLSETQWPTIATSTVLSRNRQPTWPAIRVGVLELANNDPHRTILLQVYNKHLTTAPELIGTCQASVDTFLQYAVSRQSLSLRDASGKVLDHSRIVVDSANLNRSEEVRPSVARQRLVDLRATVTAQLHKRPAYPLLFNPFSYVNYLQHGLRIKVTFAIDWTGSNGHPLDPGSLHANDASNQYVLAIQQIGRIVSPFSVPLWGAYGYGGSLGNYTGAEVSHCFPLSMDSESVPGTDGVLAAYRAAFELWSLSGPTHFSGVLAEIERQISLRDGLYHVVIILTDGLLDDLSATSEAVVRMSTAPFSLIIVGVGDLADWRAMDKLDSDNSPLRSSTTGHSAMRDCVQFVPFSDFRESPEALAEAVLAEIPRQVVEWAAIHHILPEQVATH